MRSKTRAENAVRYRYFSTNVLCSRITLFWFGLKIFQIFPPSLRWRLTNILCVRTTIFFLFFCTIVQIRTIVVLLILFNYLWRSLTRDLTWKSQKMNASGIAPQKNLHFVRFSSSTNWLTRGGGFSPEQLETNFFCQKEMRWVASLEFSYVSQAHQPSGSAPFTNYHVLYHTF